MGLKKPSRNLIALLSQKTKSAEYYSESQNLFLRSLTAPQIHSDSKRFWRNSYDRSRKNITDAVHLLSFLQ